MSDSQSDMDPSKDPNMIRVFDAYGREMFIEKQHWRRDVLPNTLKNLRDKPDELYNAIASALQDGFAADIVSYAEHLHKIDPISSRSTTALGIVYMEIGQLARAQRVFDEYLAKHGENGTVLTNLAKVYSRRGDEERAESLLWRALELDPNMENGLGWYAAIQRDHGGEAAALDAYRRVAAHPFAWRARLWLARDALGRGDLEKSETLYGDALSIAGRPVPHDLLMQMSGDLGNSGYLSQLVRLTEPYFDASFHGLLVGNNLIKANLELGRLDKAKCLLDTLYAQERPDWRNSLNFWDTELAKARIAAKPVSVEPATVTMITIEGPLWMGKKSPFHQLLPDKHKDSARIAFFGSTALHGPQVSDRPKVQLSDTPGRLGRALPLVLAEHIHLCTDGVGIAFIPWAQDQGFVLFGKPYGDAALCDIAGMETNAPEIIVSCIIDTTQSLWKLKFAILKRADGCRLDEVTIETVPETPGQIVDQVAEELVKIIMIHTCLRKSSAPPWYQRPCGKESSDYLLRLEQQLAVACFTHMDVLKGGGLSGERDILDGALQLSVRHPINPTVRMLFAQTLRKMKEARPDILPEYKDKTIRLQNEYPLGGAVAELVERAIAEVFCS